MRGAHPGRLARSPIGTCFMTTSPPKPANGTHADDPLAQIEAQIRRGVLTEPVGRRMERRSVDEAPLEWLEARLAEASNPTMWAETLLESIRHAEGPLAELDDWMRRARDLKAPADGYPEDVGADGADPVERLQAAIQREIDEMGSRRSVLERDSATQQPVSDAEAAVGREVLNMLENRDLSGAARSEATRQLATALQDPDEEALRRVLEILLFE